MRKILVQYTCVFLLTCAAVWAQAVSGTLSGRVTSAAGAGVPNAAVTVTDAGTNASQKVLTGPDGTFSISGLAPGTYRVDVETAGYRRTSQQSVELTAGGATVNITIEPGSSNETVEIQAAAPNTQSENGQIATAINTREVQELPVAGRNYQQLVGLETGVTPPETALDMVTDPERNRYYSVNGQSPLTIQRQIDGVNNTEPFRNTAIRVMPVEAIQQLNVVTSTLTMDRGYTGGAFVSPLMRGGTNGWHGSLFEFWSGNIINAGSPFNAGNASPRFNYNQMGGTFGGAIVPDKTFFFGSYEGTFANGSQTQLNTVPTSTAAMGDFSAIPGLTVYDPASGINGSGLSAIPGNVLPSGTVNPTSAAIASLLPAPNLPGLYNNYLSSVPYRNHGNKADARIDQRFSDRLSAFLRYGFTNYSSTQESALGSILGAGTTDRLLAQNAVAAVTYELRPSLVTDFRFGYNRYDQNLRPWGDQSALGALLGTSLTNNLVGINISGMLPIGASANVPQNGIDNTFDWVWSWSLHTRSHSIKWGVDIRRLRTDGFTGSIFNSPFGPNGTAFFGPGATLDPTATLSPYGAFYNSYAAFLLGAPSQVGISNYLVPPSIRQSQYSAWVGDTLQIIPRVTLDIGVRYDAFSPLEPRNPGGAQYFDPTTNTFNYAGIGGTGMHYTRWDANNIAPRIGFAVRATNKTVIRGGYGIQYYQLPYILSGFMAPVTGGVAGTQGTYGVAPFTGTFSPTVSANIPPPSSLANGASAGNLPAVVLNPGAQTPYVQTYSFQVQQEFFWTTVLSVGYAGTLGRQLPFFNELNAGLPGMGATGLPFAAFGRTASTVYTDQGLTNNYNALQVQLNKRFSKGMSFLASYTYSKALGYDTINGFLLNPALRQANYGPLAYDRQHLLTISHLLELPFGKHGNSVVQTALGGWQLNGVFTWATGTPLNITADPLLCNCANTTVLASYNGSGPMVSQSGTSYLNPAAFTYDPANPFGNLGAGSVRAPGYRNYDLSLFKNFRYHDRYNLELRGEAYNLTNTPRFLNPVTDISSPGFGQQTQTLNGAWGRQVNLALRLMF